MYDKHPDLFEKASDYERFTRKGNTRIFRWNEKYYLDEMIKPRNREKIIKDFQKKCKTTKIISRALIDNF